jgi:hypothetical protein
LKFVPENAPKNYLTDLKKASATVKYYTEEKDTPEVAI